MEGYGPGPYHTEMNGVQWERVVLELTEEIDYWCWCPDCKREDWGTLFADLGHPVHPTGYVSPCGLPRSHWQPALDARNAKMSAIAREIVAAHPEWVRG